MDPNVSTSSTTTTTTSTPPKEHKRAIILLTILLVLMIAAAIGVYFWQQMKIDDLNKQINTLNQQKNSQPATTTEPAAEMLSIADDAIQLILPEGWQASRQPEVEEQGCLAAITADIRGDCVYRANLLPADFEGESMWTVSAFKTDATMKAFVDEALGVADSRFTVNNNSINEYETHYAKIVDDAYTDINYFVRHEGYIVFFSARESSTSSAGETDNSQYTPDFTEFVKSIEFTEASQ